MLTSVLRIQDVYPRFWLFSIPDPGSNNSNKKGGGKNLVVLPFFIATNITKFNILYFWTGKEKNLSQCTKNYSTFYPKNCLLALKNMGLGNLEKTYPGSRGQKGTGSRIRIRNTGWHALDTASPAVWMKYNTSFKVFTSWVSDWHLGWASWF
jgi:hypothetical protein